MKKIGIIIFAVALVVGLIVANMFSFGKSSSNFFNFPFKIGGVKGSGNLATENRGLSEFKSVDVGSVFQVEITAQKDFGVEVEADDNLLPLIKTEVVSGVLKINSEQKMSPSHKIRVRISSPNIETLEVSGAANVTVNDLKNSDLKINASGASKIKLNGETARLLIDVSGATKIDAENLTAENANIDASGASTVTVNVTGDLRTDASGASKIYYTGTPANLEESTHGASRVSQK